ncbi:MAG: acyltransferase [Coriobacteriia bacterium]
MQLHRVIRAITFIPDRVQAKIAPVAYARRKGVNMGSGVRFYGLPNIGTEPWLITMGNNVHITRGVEFITHDGAVLILRQEVPDLEITKPITIGNDVYIGLNSILLPGSTIGDRCIVAAGSVVSGKVPSGSVVGGVPARFIKTVDEYLEKARAESLRLGHLDALSKARALKTQYGVERRR